MDETGTATGHRWTATVAIPGVGDMLRGGQVHVPPGTVVELAAMYCRDCLVAHSEVGTGPCGGTVLDFLL